jgi:hypothetical protein
MSSQSVDWIYCSAYNFVASAFAVAERLYTPLLRSGYSPPHYEVLFKSQLPENRGQVEKDLSYIFRLDTVIVKVTSQN